MADAKQVVERHIEASNARDFDADPWSADAELIAPGAHFRGLAEIHDFVRGFWDAFPDMRLELSRLIGEQSIAAGEGTFSGTHTGAMRTPTGDVPPTERHVEFRWAAVYEIRDDELISEHLYFDQVDLLGQLGLLPG